ncbi:hypothetical protein Y032_0018g3566 [Ancylostoma ceylanicum]|uniref:Uncharacterized protein n=1 Tax=Ancylostoma ceylanicum TaxID=53326 RepID=A0A016V4A6_9BILA|nr:hypothetical protein Y032_0018g3566 [Ancylostoma ceylanicum]
MMTSADRLKIARDGNTKECRKGEEKESLQVSEGPMGFSKKVLRSYLDDPEKTFAHTTYRFQRTPQQRSPEDISVFRPPLTI